MQAISEMELSPSSMISSPNYQPTVIDWTQCFELLSRLQDSSPYVVDSASPSTSTSYAYSSWPPSDIGRARILLQNMPLEAREILIAPIRQRLLDETTFLHLRNPENGEIITVRAKDILDLDSTQHELTEEVLSDNLIPNNSVENGEIAEGNSENFVITVENLENDFSDASISFNLRQALTEKFGASAHRSNRLESGESSSSALRSSMSTEGSSSTEFFSPKHLPSVLLHPPSISTGRSTPSIFATESSSMILSAGITEMTIDTEYDYASFRGSSSSISSDSSSSCFASRTSKLLVLFGFTMISLFLSAIVYAIISDRFASAVGGDPMECPKHTTYDFVGFSFSEFSLISLLFLLVLSIATRIPAAMRMSTWRTLIGPTNSHNLIGLPYLVTLSCFFFLFALFYDRVLISTTDGFCRMLAAMQYTCLLKVIVWSIFKALNIFDHFYDDCKIGRWLKATIGREYVPFTICLVVPTTISLTFYFAFPEFFKPNGCYCWIDFKYVGYAVILPMCLLAGIGFVFSLLLIGKFFTERRLRVRRLGTKGYEAQCRQFKQEIFVYISMLGMVTAPWILQWFTYEPVNLTMFYVCINLQGVALCAIYLLTRCSCEL